MLKVTLVSPGVDEVARDRHSHFGAIYPCGGEQPADEPAAERLDCGDNPLRDPLGIPTGVNQDARMH
jgi:hypothetical protein